MDGRHEAPEYFDQQLDALPLEDAAREIERLARLLAELAAEPVGATP